MNLTDDERKMLLLGLAHLAGYLNDRWNEEFRRVAMKLDGADLFDELLGLQKEQWANAAQAWFNRRM